MISWAVLLSALLPAFAQADAAPEVGVQVWVAHTDGDLRQLDRVVRDAERRGARVEPVSVGRRCLLFPADEPLDPKWVTRVERRLGGPLVRRESCAVARYPAGGGFVLAEIAPDHLLEKRVADVVDGLSMSVLTQPLDGRSASLCVSKLQVEPHTLAADLGATGLIVRGMHEVGGCVAERTRPAAKGW